jgi:Protein of unknown function (DUF3237)
MVPALHTIYAFTITARIAGVTSAGDIGHGVRRIIPITGGEVRGERVNGKVLPSGADFQIIRPSGLIELEAKYAFQTNDGAVVYVDNKGIRFGPVELLEKLNRGEPVDPKLIYFRTLPKFKDRRCEIPLADATHLRRLRRAPRRGRRDRRVSGVVSRSGAVHPSFRPSAQQRSLRLLDFAGRPTPYFDIEVLWLSVPVSAGTTAGVDSPANSYKI